MKTQQSGFAHAVLIIGLVVAIIGALGFIFWQNFIHEEPDTKNQTVSNNFKDKHEFLLTFPSWAVGIDKDLSSVKGTMYEDVNFEYAAVRSLDKYNIYSNACNGEQLGTVTISDSKQRETVVNSHGLHYNFKRLLAECPQAAESTGGKDANIYLDNAVSVFVDSLKTVRTVDENN